MKYYATAVISMWQCDQVPGVTRCQVPGVTRCQVPGVTRRDQVSGMSGQCPSCDSFLFDISDNIKRCFHFNILRATTASRLFLFPASVCIAVVYDWSVHFILTPDWIIWKRVCRVLVSKLWYYETISPLLTRMVRLLSQDV